MADNDHKTTSSLSLNDVNNNASLQMPKPEEAQLITKLAENISKNYQIAKQRQLKQHSLGNAGQAMKMRYPELKSSSVTTDIDEEWPEISSLSENKLKRKKTLSSSLTSVSDTVNQEKRTRIEGMQLNCRGKLPIKADNASNSEAYPANKLEKSEKIIGKPPLPNSALKQVPQTNTFVQPPRLKRKLQENVQTIQKLNALTEQLRLEINELKTNLTTERGAVRVLRAQNEAETRKWKTEVKKLQNALELFKKTNATIALKKNENINNETMMTSTNASSLVHYEIQRLTAEINNLKEANKTLEEKKLINCDADRRKAADIRELRDSYEIRLTQIQKSAKNEITRLLEEIKTKERNIGQLKKDLLLLQNSKATSNDLKRNATSSNATITTNNVTSKTTTTTTINPQLQSNNINTNINKNYNKLKLKQIVKLTPQQIKKNSKDSNNNINNTKTIESNSNSNENAKDITDEAQHPIEISKLKNIELINNTKNQQQTVTITTNNNAMQNVTMLITPNPSNHNLTTITRPPTATTAATAAITTTTINPLQQHLKALEIPEDHNGDEESDKCNNNHYRNLLTTNDAGTTTTTTTTTSTANIAAMTSSYDQEAYEEQNLRQELRQHLLQNNPNQSNDKNHHQQHNHSSDSDSALSSAPPSISPQPPANGVEPTDIWQTIRSYNNDIEKLQKDLEIMQKQNECLRLELSVAKDQIVDMEKTTLETKNNYNLQHLTERIKFLEEQEHQLQAECNDLREQNELLEFRILELEEANDKWSLQSDANNTTNDPTPITANSSKSVWSCSTLQNPSAKADPFEMLFGNSSITNAVNTQSDSGTLSPESSQRNRDNDELVTPLYSVCHEEIYHRILNILKSNCLEEDDTECLRQVLTLIQQFAMSCTPQSGPASLNASSSCSDETNSLDLVKSRSSDYSSGSSTSSSARSILDNGQHATSSKSNTSTAQSRIIATVQPYHSTPPYQYNNNNNNNSNSNFNSNQSFVPHNTPTDSPRKIRYHQPWQSNSLSESGVFVEADFLSDNGDNHVGTQTDYEDRLSLVSSPVKFIHPQFSNPAHYKTPALQLSPNLSDKKRLQYYQDRLTLLEGKILVYESSGDIQTKRLADRLQREIQLGKEVKELKDRVESLLQENLILEEEKCEFEEAENDTRLRLQRLEVELEILSQRNVELDVSREALSAKYKDCHSECLILRDDLAASETQIRHLEEDKQKAKENFEFLHNLLPILLLSNSLSTLAFFEKSASAGATNSSIPIDNQVMGSKMSQENGSSYIPKRFPGGETRKDAECGINKEHELQYLREEVKCLRHQMKEMNSRHYAAMESADCHWVELERQYKEREDQYLAKEICLKQKIQKLQDCIKDDTKSANDKICLLEEAERGLKTCLVRVTKEHRELVEDHKQLLGELEELKEQHEATLNNQTPLLDALDQEKKRNKSLIDELSFLTRLQQETENQNKSELDCLRSQLHDIKKEFLHVDVTNAELKEEVSTLEQQVLALQNTVHDYEDRTRCLTDEIRNKDEQVQRLEKRIQRTEADSLAEELGDTSSRRLQRDKIKDLKTANRFLKKALHNMKDCENPTPEVKQFSEVATEVSRLAKWMLQEQKLEEDEHQHQEQEHGRHRAERDWARLDPGKLWTQDQGRRKYTREFLAESK
ncbi:PFTAIRE-interacting factor 1A isoform 2-T5 [Glossina fuscipes fuscipes]